MSEPRPLRLFFALWPDAAMQSDLAHAVRKAVRASGGRPVPPENTHLTLAFLGSVSADAVALLGEVAQRVAPAVDTEQIAVVLDRIEHWKKPQLLCATASATPPAAISLANGLRRELTAAGFAPDLKPFRVHVTLARKVLRLTRDLDMHSVAWSFRSLSLIASETRPEGSLYSVVDSWTLCGSRSSAISPPSVSI